MELLAEKIARHIARQFAYNEEKTAVVRYGLIAMLQTIMIFIITSVVGIICGFFWESFTVFVCVGLLRKQTGGAHADTMNGCMVMSCMVIMLASFIARYVFICLPWYLSAAFFCVVFIFSGILIFAKAPVDHPNKPIKNPKKRKKLRKNSFIVLFLYVLVAFFFLFVWQQTHFSVWCSVASAIILSCLWQVSTLTQPVARLIHRFRHMN